MSTHLSKKHQLGATILYIAGAGHSGSTLLSLLLENHPEISAVGELHRLSIHPDTRKCACGDPIISCQYWRQIIEYITGSLNINRDRWWHDFPVSSLNIETTKGMITGVLLRAALVVGNLRLLELLSGVSAYTRKFLQVGSNSWKLCDAIATVNNAKIVVDATKIAPRLKLLYLLRPQQLKILHLVRDGRAYVASGRRRRNRSIADAATQWVRVNRQVLLVLKTIPSNQQYFLRYEDLCDNPKKELSALMDFLELEYSEALSQLNAAGVHTIPGNEAMLEKMHTTGSTVIRKDERWEKSMAEEDLMIFNNIAGRMNQRFGYHNRIRVLPREGSK